MQKSDLASPNKLLVTIFPKQMVNPDGTVIVYQIHESIPRVMKIWLEITCVDSEMICDASALKVWVYAHAIPACGRAVWYNQEYFPNSWEIDPTEGPGRVRKRMQRCHMANIQPKFLLEEHQYKVALAKTDSPLHFLFEEGSQMESASAALIYRLHTNLTIRSALAS